MEINSINILGITGGVGYEFLKQCSNNSIKNICGVYFSDTHKASEIQKKFTDVTLIQTDLSVAKHNDFVLPNYECLAFFAGSPFFSENLFSATSLDFVKQINLHTISLIRCIFDILHYENSNLKKVILLGSYTPSKLSSVYHFSKLITDNALELLLPVLNEKGISLSIVRASWIDTKMYHEYKKHNTNFSSGSVLEPAYVAQVCFQEVFNVSPFNIVKL